MSTGVYLAYPIDQAENPEFYLPMVKEWLADRPEVDWIFDPGAAFTIGSSPTMSSGIREINEAALLRAGLLVAFMPAGVPSIGVPMEIQRAISLGTPTLVISDAPSWILQTIMDPDFLCVRSWREEAKMWLSEKLESTSESLGASNRTPLPVKLEEGGEAPRRGYDDDAGLDLTVSENCWVMPGMFVDILCGASAALPDWSWGLLTGRSSTLRKRGLMVNPGVIDAGYRGPLFAGVWNLTDSPVLVKKGERIAQLIVMVNGTRDVEVVVVDELEPGSRGSAGFGSTGT